MREIKLLHKLLSKSLPDIHKKRLNSLMSGVKNGLNGNKLTLTALGRSSEDNSQVKNKIKRMDRLLGNTKLHMEINDIYKSITNLLISNKKHPIISVDWASVDNRNKFHVLKASISYEGRSITIFDQIEYKDRPNKQENNSHDKFINNLSEILPENCQPIIVTDAAFSAKWAKRIEEKNWYWITRLRGRIRISKGESSWLKCNDFFNLATGTPKELGEHIIAKKNPLKCNLFLYKKFKKNRTRKNKNGSIKKCNPCNDYKKAANEPWLLASNLPKSFTRAKKVIKYYSMRMQIEETFRDTKSLNYGLGIKYTLSETKERISVLMLISTLILLILGVLGKAAYEKGIHKEFQANTIKNRKVLSLWYLGRQIYEHMRGEASIKELLIAFFNILEGIQNYDI